jgi:hypothetical protein
MAQVHEYAIVTQTRHSYTSEGTNHVDALNKFIINPAIVAGFHSGNYTTEAGERFVVIGPGKDGPMTSVTLVAVESRSFVFKTPEQIERDRKKKDEMFSKWNELRGQDHLGYEVEVNQNLRVPPYDLTDETLDLSLFGIRVNNVLVPWSFVEDIEPITT